MNTSHRKTVNPLRGNAFSLKRLFRNRHLLIIDMLIIAGKYLKEINEIEKGNSQFRIALKIMDAFEEDFIEHKWFKATVFEYTHEQRKEVEALLAE